MRIDIENLLKNTKLENVEISIGEIVEEDDFEPMGQFPKPPYIRLRAWDHFLFSRYKPTYVVENVDEHVKNLFRLTIAGTSNLIAIARNRLKYAYQRLGRDADIKLGLDIEAPLTRTLIGIKPKRLADLEVVMDYILTEFAECVASIHSSNEQNHLDFESKMFHLGMLTLLACEVAEIPYMMLTEDFPQTLEWGFGLVDAYKPVVLIVGDFPAVDLLIKFGKQVELVAGGCYALDMWKLSGGKVKICCVQSDLIDFIRSGVPDVVIVGENGAIPLDVAKESNCKVLSCSPRICMGLPDLTSLDEEKIVEEVEKGFGAIITDFEKISKVAVDLAISISTKRKSKFELNLPRDVYKAKPPFGAFPEDVIRNVGVPVVMGTIPGVVAVVGCSEFDVKELGFVVENLAKRNYLILTTGCTALQLSKVGVYDHENVILMGSPTAIAHIAGLALKVGAIFARLPLRGNGLAVLDYLLNRVGAVGLAWSKPEESLIAIAWGVLRSGIPIVVGKNLAVAGRLFLGDVNDKRSFEVFDNRTKKKVFSPTPEHLLCLANDEKEALILVSKLVMRPNDGGKCRAIKVGNYIEFYERFNGELPPDLHNFIRSKEEILPMRRGEILKFLEEKGWKQIEPSTIDPTVIPLLQS